MKRPFIPFVTFLVLLVLTFGFSFNFATSVVPGSHTRVYPPYFIFGLVLSVVLLFVTVGYWILSVRTRKVSWTFFGIHLLLTVPTGVFLRFPTLFLDIEQANQEEIIKSLNLRIQLIPFAWILFVIGQILFIVYFIRKLRAKQTGAL